jgi:hypothetical protein
VAELLPEFFGGFLLTFLNFATIDDDVVFVPIPVNLNETKREFVETHIGTPTIQTLFFDRIAEKADQRQRCSTFLLPQCGQMISPSS